MTQNIPVGRLENMPQTTPAPIEFKSRLKSFCNGIRRSETCSDAMNLAALEMIAELNTVGGRMVRDYQPGPSITLEEVNQAKAELYRRMASLCRSIARDKRLEDRFCGIATDREEDLNLRLERLEV